MIYKNYGELIGKARKNKNISQEQLALKLNVSRQAVSNWENNKCYPDISLVPKLCNILDINIYDFFDNEKGLKILELEKRKVKYRNNIIILFSTLILFLLVILILSINKNNEYSYYSISIDSDEFRLKNAHFIETSDLYYLNFGTVAHDYNSYVYVRIYMMEGNEKNVILSGNSNTDLIIHEYKGYNEYFNDFDISKDELFIEFEYLINGNKVLVPYELEFNLEFKKKKLFGGKVTEIGDDTNEEKNINEFNVNKILNAGYSFDDSSGHYKKFDNNLQYIILGCSNSLVIMFNENNKHYYLEYNSDMNDIYVSVYDMNLEEFILEFSYFINSDQLIYSVGSENADKYITLVLNELEILQ